MKDFDALLAEQMKYSEFKAEWDRLEPEFAIVSAIYEARTEKKLSQKQFSEFTGIA